MEDTHGTLQRNWERLFSLLVSCDDVSPTMRVLKVLYQMLQNNGAAL
jgi:hypothetical protein